MRLLNAETKHLEEFVGEESVPKYAILSHTWGADEVSFQDFQNCTPRFPPSTVKIDGSCREALRHGCQYVWIDTCCIDKSSSSELSEAINSMYEWYRKAAVCLIYLADVTWTVDDIALEGSMMSYELRESRWFTRGWTLQELLASSQRKFFNKSWRQIGELCKRSRMSSDHNDTDFAMLVSDITSVPLYYIYDERRIKDASVACRMSWAAKRQTTRVEDTAYCLLGLFGVNMPLLYGEGLKAFVRLQEEIMKVSDDQSLFAWGYGADRDSYRWHTSTVTYFATSPDDFEQCANLIPLELSANHYSVTNKGLQIKMAVVRLTTGDYVGCLDCMTAEDLQHDAPIYKMAIPLWRCREEGKFYRPRLVVPKMVDSTIFVTSVPRPIYIARDRPPHFETPNFRDSGLFTNNGPFSLKAVYPTGLVYVTKGNHTSQICFADTSALDEIGQGVPRIVRLGDGTTVSPKGGGKLHQLIFMDCATTDAGTPFAVMISYTYDVSEDYGEENVYRTHPRGLECFGTRLGSCSSLPFEYMVPSRTVWCEVENEIVWERVIDIDGRKMSFDATMSRSEMAMACISFTSPSPKGTRRKRGRRST